MAADELFLRLFGSDVTPPEIPEDDRDFVFVGSGVTTSGAEGATSPQSRQNRTALSSGALDMQVELRIALYVAIFVLSLAGNTLVALTIAQNRRMRTLTNVLLMNLSVADLLLAMFCMPFTLIPTLLKNFIFGPVICVLVRYMQGSYLWCISMLARRVLLSGTHADE